HVERLALGNGLVGYFKPISQIPPTLSLEVLEEAVIGSALNVFLVRFVDFSATMERHHLYRLQAILGPLRVDHPAISTNSSAKAIRVIPQYLNAPFVAMSDRLGGSAENVFH